jgi:hypothetical protein
MNITKKNRCLSVAGLRLSRLDPDLPDKFEDRALRRVLTFHRRGLPRDPSRLPRLRPTGPGCRCRLPSRVPAPGDLPRPLVALPAPGELIPAFWADSPWGRQMGWITGPPHHHQARSSGRACLHPGACPPGEGMPLTFTLSPLARSRRDRYVSRYEIGVPLRRPSHERVPSRQLAGRSCSRKCRAGVSPLSRACSRRSWSSPLPRTRSYLEPEARRARKRADAGRH